jgi:hypothetical protein
MPKKFAKSGSEDGGLKGKDDPKSFSKYQDIVPGNHVKSNQATIVDKNVYSCKKASMHS